jgi:EAL domain-containing protein (putative c-di-GMP-specific phosphodiesterase class I)
MAKALNKKVIAEGVENKETALKLIDMGVDFLQGYYFARPSPETNFNLRKHIAICAQRNSALV